MNKKLTLLAITTASLVTLNACNSSDNNSFAQNTASKAKLGEELFNDDSLSRDGNQSCATCHNPEHAFIDDRNNPTSHDDSTPGSVSEGQDDTALGDRNTPTATYAAFIPDFHFDASEDDGLFKGGQFLDGREKNLQGQAGQPFLNPVEMQTTKADVVAKVKNKYGNSMRENYGDDIFNTTDKAYDAITDSIAKFEKTEEFAPFDSKFDRVLKGNDAFTSLEAKGLELFKAEDKGNCAACHPVPTALSSKEDSTFTDFTYDNLGVPRHDIVRSLNNNNGKGFDDDFVDNGLFENPAVNDPELKGAFRVSTLRNIAVTAPYMHNGVFKDLKTVVHFYNTRDVDGAINPETWDEWRASEVDVTKNTEELGDLKLTDHEKDALVAFMKTLTDSRYEHLIPE
ncbi:MAG TPA: methylamine utilization protein MauG [Leucothrix sp.]|nr:methylamine utilization protein MauG [Leucothrix sp.]